MAIKSVQQPRYIQALQQHKRALWLPTQTPAPSSYMLSKHIVCQHLCNQLSKCRNLRVEKQHAQPETSTSEAPRVSKPSRELSITRCTGGATQRPQASTAQASELNNDLALGWPRVSAGTAPTAGRARTQ